MVHQAEIMDLQTTQFLLYFAEWHEQGVFACIDSRSNSSNDIGVRAVVLQS